MESYVPLHGLGSRKRGDSEGFIQGAQGTFEEQQRLDMSLSPGGRARWN